MSGTETKICTKCSETKPLSEYYHHSGNDKPYPHCKTCHLDYKIARKCWFKYGRYNEVEDQKAQSLWTRHHITPEMYNYMEEKQGGTCAICRRPPGNGKTRLCIDHDHSCCPSGKSCYKCRRGLLCDSCNRSIGLMQDDPEILYEAQKYLYNKVDVLGSLGGGH